MVSALDRAKRAFVVVLLSLANTYRCSVNVTRESSDADIRKAYRAMPTASARERDNATASGPQHRSESSCHFTKVTKNRFQSSFELLAGIP